MKSGIKHFEFAKAAESRQASGTMERRNDNETAEGTERKPSWIKVRLPNGREFWEDAILW